jgi:hypothetical protein
MNFSLEQQKRIGYLQKLANKYGDFRVTYLKKREDGEIERRKWRTVKECWETEEGLYFLSIVNNREPLPIELFIDLDVEVEGETREETFNQICDFLEENNDKYVGYKSGSKGYHIHLYSYELAILNKYQREKLKEKFLKKLLEKESDQLKYSDHTMLALEDVPHWKTGNKKVRVRGNWELLTD